MINDEERFHILDSVVKLHEKLGHPISGRELLNFYSETTSTTIKLPKFNQQLKELQNEGSINAQFLEENNGAIEDVQFIQITGHGNNVVLNNKQKSSKTSRTAIKWIIGFMAVSILAPIIVHQVNRYLDSKFPFDVEKKDNQYFVTPKSSLAQASGEIVIVDKGLTPSKPKIVAGFDFVKEISVTQTKALYSIKNLPHGKYIAFSFDKDRQMSSVITDLEGKPLPVKIAGGDEVVVRWDD